MYEVIANKYKLAHSDEVKNDSVSSANLFSNGKKREIIPTDISSDTSLPLLLLSKEEKTEVVIK